jgi:hypothetical protein
VDDFSFVISLQLVAFCGLLGAFVAADSIKVLVSGYQSIDMHCIALRVKFEDGLFISVLRIGQLFKKKKKMEDTISHSQNVQTF